jgi:hypothetical protein
MTDLAPTPPDQSEWWDQAVHVANVLTLLRITDGDVDADRVDQCVAAAGRHINNRLDRVDPIEPPGPPNLQVMLERVAVDLYHGIVPDPAGLVAAQGQADRQRFGVG